MTNTDQHNMLFNLIAWACEARTGLDARGIAKALDWHEAPVEACLTALMRHELALVDLNHFGNDATDFRSVAEIYIGRFHPDARQVDGACPTIEGKRLIAEAIEQQEANRAFEREHEDRWIW